MSETLTEKKKQIFEELKNEIKELEK